MLNVNNLGGEYKSQLYDITDHSAISRFTNNILSDMDPLLTSRQLTELNVVLQKTINNYSISDDGELYHDVNWQELNDDLLSQFLEGKRLAGLSEKTLMQYDGNIRFVFQYLQKGADTVTADDIREFMEWAIEERKIQMVTVDNYRRFLNSFYNWCVNNGLLYKNPLLKINAVKRVKKVKQAFSYKEIIYLRENITNLRDKAIFELLLSSGMRIGELTQLNYKDLDMKNCTVIVHGKGDKEREVFFNELARVSIERYLESRKDNNPALFVSLKRNHRSKDSKKYEGWGRLNVGGCESMLRDLGRRAGVSKVHPHRFRRHFATNLIQKGVNIEQVQQLLGHAEIETTQMYIVSDEDEIQYNHKRYVN